MRETLLKIFLHPIFWPSRIPIDHEWDTILNLALDKHRPVVEMDSCLSDGSPCAVSIGDVRVFVSDWPHGYGSPLYRDLPREVLPYPKTRIRLRQAVEDVLPENTNAKLYDNLREKLK